MLSGNQRVLRGNFLTRYLSSTVTDLLPSRVKRMMYLGSAIGILLNCKIPSPELLEKINAELRIAYGAGSIAFPVYFCDKIWNKDCIPIDGKTVAELSNETRWRISVAFATNCPEWMRYGSQQLMVYDMFGTINGIGNIERA